MKNIESVIETKMKNMLLKYPDQKGLTTKAREQNVKKQYAIGLLDIFLDNDIMLYLN